MMLAGTTVVGDLKCLTCQLKTVSWSVERLLKSNPSACLSPSLVRSGPSRPPSPLMTWQILHPLSLTRALASLM